MSFLLIRQARGEFGARLLYRHGVRPPRCLGSSLFRLSMMRLYYQSNTVSVHNLPTSFEWPCQNDVLVIKASRHITASFSGLSQFGDQVDGRLQIYTILVTTQAKLHCRDRWHYTIHGPRLFPFHFYSSRAAGTTRFKHTSYEICEKQFDTNLRQRSKPPHSWPAGILDQST